MYCEDTCSCTRVCVCGTICVICQMGFYLQGTRLKHFYGCCSKIVKLRKTFKGPIFTEHRHKSCDDVNDNAPIKNNGVTPDRSCKPFWSESIVFNENSTATVFATLMLTLSVSLPGLVTSD